MNHPSQEQLVTYLYGELGTDARAEVGRHLDTCADCRATVQAWRGAMRGLDAWRLPAQAGVRARVLRVAGMAAAALVLLAVGFGLGRSPALGAPDVRAVRAEVESAVTAALLPALREQLAQDVEAWGAQWQAAVAADLRAEVDSAALQAVATSSAVTDRAVRDLARALDEARQQDRQAVLAALGYVDRQRRSDSAALEGYVRALASATGDELLRTQHQVAVLAAWSPAAAPAPQENQVLDSQSRGG